MLVPEIVTATAHLLGLIPLQIPDPAPVQPPGTGGITTIIGWLKWVGFAVVGGAIIVGGIMIAVSMRHGEGGQSISKILWPMAGAIIIGGGVGLVSALIQ